MPHEIAIELFQPFVICSLIRQHRASNMGVADTLFVCLYIDSWNSLSAPAINLIWYNWIDNRLFLIYYIISFNFMTLPLPIKQLWKLFNCYSIRIPKKKKTPTDFLSIYICNCSTSLLQIWKVPLKWVFFSPDSLGFSN